MSSISSSSNAYSRITRRRGACTQCRQRKVRCNGASPCALCQKQKTACQYRPPSIGGGNSLRSIQQSTRGRVNENRHLPTPSYESIVDDYEFLNTISTSSPIDNRGGLSTSQPLVPPTDNGITSQLNFDFTGLENTAVDADSSALFDLDSYFTIATTPTIASLSQTGENRSVHPERDQVSDLSQYCGANPLEATVASVVGRYRQSLFPALCIKTLESINGRGAVHNFNSPWLPNFQARSNMKSSRRDLLSSLLSSLLCRRYHMCMPASWAGMVGGNVLSNSDYMRLIASAHTGGCFEEIWGVHLYLDRRQIAQMATRATQDTGDTEPDFSVIEMCTLSVLVAWNALLEPIQDARKIATTVAKALALESDMQIEHDSIEKFLALVALLNLSKKAGLYQLPILLAATVSMIQLLGLGSEASLQALCVDIDSMNRVKRACWVVYCIEKAYSMRYRTFSIIPRSAIQYDAPDPTETSESHQAIKEWFRSQCQYAKLCAEICQVTNHAENSNQYLNVKRLTAELQHWFDFTLSSFTESHGESSSDSMRTYLSFQYSEAILALIQIPNSSTTLTIVAPGGDHSIRLGSLAKAIFVTGRKIRYAEFDGNQLYVPTLLLCMLAMQEPHTTKFSDARICFALAHGFFAETSPIMPTTSFFDDITKLIDNIVLDYT